jgi:hypothetical protein
MQASRFSACAAGYVIAGLDSAHIVVSGDTVTERTYRRTLSEKYVRISAHDNS